jgi:hypothetical protein
MNEDKKVGLNEQDAPHKEGQYGNTSANPSAEENISRGMSQMNEDNSSNSNRSQPAPAEHNKTPGTARE